MRTPAIQTKIKDAIERGRWVEPGQHLLVAVSGGADSVSLLHALCELRASLHLTLSVCHLNHRLRKAAAADADFVRDLAERSGLHVLVGTADVRGLAQRKGLSIEMAAREARYRFFARAARRLGADAVTTAHTADDVAETVLLNLARGAGPAGLSGIGPCVRLKGTRIVRPMLDVSRQEVLKYLHLHGCAWREDESNRDRAFLRNRVRGEILPLLEQRINPGARDALVRTARIIRDEDEWVTDLAREALPACLVPGRGSPGLDVQALRKHPVAARRRLLRAWLTRGGVEATRLSLSLLDRLESLVEHTRGSASISIGDGLCVTRRYSVLLVEPAKDAVPPFRVRLAVPGETLLPEQGLRITLAAAHGILKPPCSHVGTLPAQGSLSKAAVGRCGLYVRSWKAGDRIRPLGMRGSRKLQDVFVDAKIPAAQRASVPVFECRGEVVWVPGYRVGEGWHVPAQTSPALHISVERISWHDELSRERRK